MNSPFPHFFCFSRRFDVFAFFFMTALSLPPHNVRCSFRCAFSTPISSTHHLPFHPRSWLHSKTTVCSIQIIPSSGNKGFIYSPLNFSVCSSNQTQFFMPISLFSSSPWGPFHHNASTTYHERKRRDLGSCAALHRTASLLCFDSSWVSNYENQIIQWVGFGTQESPVFS